MVWCGAVLYPRHVISAKFDGSDEKAVFARLLWVHDVEQPLCRVDRQKIAALPGWGGTE